MFEEDRSRAAYRRYLAALRKSYGNAISDSNRRPEVVYKAESPHCSQFGNPGQLISRTRRGNIGGQSVRLGNSNAYSGYKGIPLTTQTLKSVTAPSKYTPPLPERKWNGMSKGYQPVKKNNRESNLRQYEMLQKRALADSLFTELKNDKKKPK